MVLLRKGFPDSSTGKESACSAGDPALIPGLGRSPREGIGYPLQYFWVSLVVKTVKNLPAMWDTGVLSLGWEDHLEKGMAHPSILAWRIPQTEEPGRLQSSMGSQRIGHNWATKHTHTHIWLNHFAVHQKLIQHYKRIILQFKKEAFVKKLQLSWNLQ